MIGQRFGRLVVMKEVDRVKCRRMYMCVCDCGCEKCVSGHDLRTGHTKSCGCMERENRLRNVSKSHKKIHGESDSRLYKEYYAMRTRCKEKYQRHKSYFDKGITVCDEWTGENGFIKFSDWAKRNGYSYELTLDRIDNQKGYSPDNCRWCTNKDQQNNKDNNAYIDYMGETKTLKQWCDVLNLNYGMVKARHQRGWEVPRLFEPNNRETRQPYAI